MRNTIFLDGSVSMYSGESLLHSLQRKKSDGELTYQEILDSIKEYTADKAEKTRDDVAAMSAEQYKEYVAQKISELPRHDTKKNDTVIVDITDAGFKAMQEDENYENWVISTVAADLATENSLASMTGGRCAVHRFGANETQYSSESWGKARDVTDILASVTAAADNFWNGDSKLTKRLADEQMTYMRQQQLSQIARQMTNLQQQQAFKALNGLYS